MRVTDYAGKSVTDQHNIAVTRVALAPILKFRCRRPISGFRVLDVDHDDWTSAVQDNDSRRNTTDACFLARKWGSRGLLANSAFANSLILEPISPEFEEFDLFERHPAAFRQVAAAGERVEDIKALADRYGSLVEYSRPEDVSLWRSVVEQLKSGVALWDEAKSTNFERFCRWFERIDELRLGGVGGVESRILLAKDPQSAKARLFISPPNLMAALLVQFALAVDGNENFRRCDQCTDWFPIAVAGRRPDRIYCSDACRMRAYRSRNAKD